MQQQPERMDMRFDKVFYTIKRQGVTIASLREGLVWNGSMVKRP